MKQGELEDSEKYASLSNFIQFSFFTKVGDFKLTNEAKLLAEWIINYLIYHAD